TGRSRRQLPARKIRRRDLQRLRAAGRAAAVRAMNASCCTRLVLLATALAMTPVFAAQSPASSPEAFLIDTDGAPNLAPGWRLRLGLLASDNIGRSPDDEQEEVIGAGEFGANVRYVGPRFAGAFDGAIGYRHYTEGTFDDEARAN